MSIVEIIYNPKLEPRRQYIDLNTLLFETIFYMPQGSTFNNQTHLSFAAENGYLIMAQQDQENLATVLSCPYRSYISGGGSTCRQCDGKSTY